MCTFYQLFKLYRTGDKPVAALRARKADVRSSSKNNITFMSVREVTDLGPLIFYALRNYHAIKYFIIIRRSIIKLNEKYIQYFIYRKYAHGFVHNLKGIGFKAVKP